MSTTSAVNSAASTSTLESLLSGLNNGSQGIDVTDTVDEIISADSAPMDQLETEQTTLSNETSAITQLESEASAVSDDLSALQDTAGVLSSVEAASSDTSVLSASAADGTVIGDHTITVSSLATAGSNYSNEVASSSTTLSSGSFDITEGGQTTTISVGSGDGTGDTLTELAATINSDNLGVNASVVTDANGARLSLVSSSTGSAANVSVTNATGPLSFNNPVTGADASLIVDGVPITSASNTVTGAITGVTLNLTGTTASNSPVTLTLAPDTTDIVSAVTSFVNDYNTLINDVNSQFDYDATTSTDGTLSSDSAVRSFQSDLLSATNFSLSSNGSLPTLASLGVSTNQDGTLTLDSTTLTNAIASDPSGVVNFFQGSGSTTGFAAAFTNTLNNYTDPTQGAFTVDLSSISSENTELQDEINTDQDYLNQEQTTLTTEYNNANIALQDLPTEIKNTQVLLGDYSSSSSSSS